MTTDGGPAFPQGSTPAHAHPDSDCGMTLRDYFAAQAVQGLLASCDGPGLIDYTKMVQASWDFADAMLAEREKKP